MSSAMSSAMLQHIDAVIQAKSLNQLLYGCISETSLINTMPALAVCLWFKFVILQVAEGRIRL